MLNRLRLICQRFNIATRHLHSPFHLSPQGRLQLIGGCSSFCWGLKEAEPGLLQDGHRQCPSVSYWLSDVFQPPPHRCVECDKSSCVFISISTVGAPPQRVYCQCSGPFVGVTPINIPAEDPKTLKRGYSALHRCRIHAPRACKTVKKRCQECFIAPSLNSMFTFEHLLPSHMSHALSM